MIVVLAILAATRASPLGQSSPPLVSLDQFRTRALSCDDPNGCRSLWNIIWSCAVTIFLCAWVSVHPNIPSPDERWPRVAVRRVGLMLAALFVPEMMIGWALKQRLAAVELAERHKGEGWTTTHGFFAIMGGFMEYEGNRSIRVLLPEQLESYSLTGNGDFPRIAKEEIEDRSKGDFISKSLVILQSGWFVTQIIARALQDLPITELELVTVAFATLNFVMYLLWWDKPLNVQRGVRVYKKRETEEVIDDGDVESTNSVGFFVALRDALYELPAAILRGPQLGTGFVGDPWIYRVLVWPVGIPFLIVGGYDMYEDLKRVDTFYPQHWVSGTRKRILAGCIVAAVAVTFGGIHCSGWSFAFPSNTERVLWRVASVSIVAIPIPYTLLVVLLLAQPGIKDSLPGMLGILHMILIFAYMLGRLALLVLPFLCLRSLPPAAYHVVHWATFIPHVL
ncbi:hypothetical protein F5148DRAFT_1284313 [Russula earlei]|uniref:Uncharacterized protein n=1 Tax=Russula earlei TaxID=71964 RepID=A0ACC0UAW6_9AGAM|nr:hypothetical protein F5148DRAFT_1284313 [Russula earlei]